jgi:8-oxo-dGTP pyrophosphatase MutT (NUDIX family)
VRLRKRVVVYVERDDGLLVFDHRDHPEAGTQVPAGGVHEGEDLIEAAAREVREETGVRLETKPMLLGTHEHLDGLGQSALSHFFRVQAPDGLPNAWRHVVSGDGRDANLVFDCRFDPTPELWPVQSVFRPVGGHCGTLAQPTGYGGVPDGLRLSVRAVGLGGRGRPTRCARRFR